MLFEELGEQFAISEEKYAYLCHWLKENFIPRETLNYDRVSGGLKHLFERQPDGFYVHSEILIQAMKDCGFQVHYLRDGHYCVFNISEKSPGVKIWLK